MLIFHHFINYLYVKICIAYQILTILMPLKKLSFLRNVIILVYIEYIEVVWKIYLICLEQQNPPTFTNGMLLH